MNKTILIGRVGKEPEIRKVGESKVANLSLATSEKYRSKSGETQETTEWHNIVIWGKLADVVEKYVHKGNQLALEGKIQTRKWQDKDGNDRYTTEINCSSMEMLSGAPAGAKQKQETSASGSNDDLPF